MDAVLDNLDRIVDGMGTTMALTVLSWLAAFVIGVVVASLRVGPIPPLRGVGAAYVEVVRNCPLTVLFAVFFFGFPSLGIQFDSFFVTAVIVLSVYTSAFVAETVRAGVNTVGPGQVEAARALGLSFPQVLGLVILPQSLRAVVGPLGSLFSALIRNTSIAYTIGLVELSGTASQIAIATVEFIPVFVGVALAYLALTLPTGLAVGVLERRLAIRR